MSEKTEVDKLLYSLDLMYKKLKEDEKKYYNNNIKDKFDKLNNSINIIFEEIENNLNERDKLMSSENPKDILSRKKHENNASIKLIEIEKKLKDLKIELKVQERKTNKYQNVDKKKEILEHLDKRYNLLKKKLDGDSEVEEKINDNRIISEQLNDILKKKNNENYKERELYVEEKEKIEEWKKEEEEQNKDLDEILLSIRKLKGEAQKTTEGIKLLGEGVNNAGKNAGVVETKIETQNMKLKKLIKQIRSNDKICFDIILIIIIFGLICILYSIIKRKF
jgi:chromosome segregation ATPase